MCFKIKLHVFFFWFSKQNHATSSGNYVKTRFWTWNVRNLTKTLISVMFYLFFGRIRAVVPNLSSAGFGRPSQICVRPDSEGRPQSEFCQIRTVSAVDQGSLTTHQRNANCQIRICGDYACGDKRNLCKHLFLKVFNAVIGKSRITWCKNQKTFCENDTYGSETHLTWQKVLIG